MQDVHLIERAEEAGELLKPIRISILSRLAEPRTCPEIARQLGVTTQKVNYHMNVLRQAGLVQLVEERRNRGTIEGVYQAAARSFWFSPRLVADLGGRSTASDEAGLAYLLQLIEELQVDIGRLAEKTSAGQIPSVAFDGRIELADPEQRGAFLKDLKEAVENIARKYGRRGGGRKSAGDSYRFALACYPQQDGTDG